MNTLFVRRTILLLLATCLIAFALWHVFFRYQDTPPAQTIPDIQLPDHPGISLEDTTDTVTETKRPNPPSLQRMKSQGCVADGFLSDYGENSNSNIKLVNRSNCYYLHRALETWLQPPNFKLARKIQSKVTKPDLVYGMFIAEAIDTTANYEYEPEQRYFDFREMCRNGSQNKWGEHTCQPSFEKKEYMLYVETITKQAIDMGIQSFLFGQIYLQDSDDPDRSLLKTVMTNMRNYAHSQGVDIVIGAQTNDIDDESYLRLFDFIEGGTGLHADGTIEDAPCFSRWWKKDGDWCWALLWNDRFAKKANAVFIHLDWSGKLGDDMSTFARLSQEERAATLKNLHSFFLGRNVGFLLPILAPLPKNNGGCFGPKERFYSPDNRYNCKDEAAINTILRQ